MDIQEMIPKHKDDQKVIAELKKLSFEEIKPIVPDLLTWLQDINWPIARHIAEVLEPFSDKLVPDIVEILKTNDGIWKLWILVTLARKTKDETLLKEIERIAKHPTKDEIEEEVNVEAAAILNGDYI
ncbi:DUF5071 domain-containing protein [Chitinophaga silvatica]|uniref:DUF5071 domain-containing protein n=1 Tax=Chitinophaga silvatica TaxID=2282649 RepID=A0A3E1YAC3_9BACT|nr:DUF5071 domain-containing protein [Chitinophaga silvatica]RFS22694.1 DUF5071 domain-containing protein [Chitinophaga silvatica]